MIDAAKVFFKYVCFVFYKHRAELVDLCLFCVVFRLNFVNFVLEFLKEAQGFPALEAEGVDLEVDLL